MFRRTRKVLGLGIRSAMGAIAGAVVAPVARVLSDRGELTVDFFPTCNGTIIEIHIGPPCDHGDGGGGPEAFNPDEEEGTQHWSKRPPQTGTDQTDQTVWN